MTRKDYQLIAEALKRARECAFSSDAAYMVAEALSADNARFDREKFLQACGI